MKTLKDFKADAKVYEEVTTNASVRRYRAFMDYMSRFIHIMFKDNEQEIISWFNNDDGKLILSVCTGGIHYVSIVIGLSDDKSRINLVEFRAHDQYYDPKVDFNSTDESICEFFSREYSRFLNVYSPCDHSDNSIVTEFVDRFNDAFYVEFKSMFMSIGLNDFNDFKKSKFDYPFLKFFHQKKIMHI